MIIRQASAHLLRNALLRCRRSKLGIQTSSIISAPQRSCLCSRSFSVAKEIVSANGIDFRVTIKNPDASHPVLCLPGALGTGASDFASLLKEDDNNNEGLGSSEFGIYAFDPRGLGGSVNTTTDSNEIIVERDYPLDFYLRDALDAAAVMRALGIVDRYSVLGWSDGANAAVHLAAHDSTKRSVRNLVVWGGNAYVTKEDAEAWESLRDIDTWSERTRDEKAVVHGGYDKLQKLNDAATDG